MSAISDKNVLAVVVTYNRSHMLPGCLAAIKSQTAPCQILVIDNASTDATQQVLQPLLDARTACCRLEQNLGGAGGFAAGLRMGVEQGYRHLWIMDDDAYPEPEALEMLLRAEAHAGDYGFLCSAVLWTDGRECRMNRQGLHKENFYANIQLLRHSMVAVKQSTFVSCFFRAETVKQAGLPIREFFIWGDDIEYTRRLAVRQKRPCFLVGSSVVVHHMASNSGSDISTDSVQRLGRYAYAYRNENYLYRQEGLKGVLYYCARCGLHFLRIWARAKDHRLKRSWVLISSFFRGWAFRPQIEYITEA